jgi:hypothetical protein
MNRVSGFILAAFCFADGCRTVSNSEVQESGDQGQTGNSSASWGADYEALDAEKKEEQLWNEIVRTDYHGSLPTLLAVDAGNVVAKTGTERLGKKLSHKGDTIPDGMWSKPIHSFGTVAKVKFVAANGSPFTGLFAGAEFGLIRLSLLEDPYKKETEPNIAPGVALKLLVSKQASVNVSFLVSLDGQGADGNFFANQMSNMVPKSDKLSAQVSNALFKTASKFPTYMGVQDFAKVSQVGDRVSQPKYPYRIYLVPSGWFSTAIDKQHDFRTELEAIDSDSVIYEVWASDPGKYSGADAQAAANQIVYQQADRENATKIGYIVTKSKFVASKFGDSELFFRHQPFGED